MKNVFCRAEYRYGIRDSSNSGLMRKPSSTPVSPGYDAAPGKLRHNNSDIMYPMQSAKLEAAAHMLPLCHRSAGYLLVETPTGCPQGCVGYIFFPAVAAVGISAVLAAPLGAWMTYCAPVIILKRLFAFLLLCAAGNLAYKTFSPALPPPRDAVASANVSPVKMSPPTPMRKPAATYRSAAPANFGTGEPPEPAEPASIFPPPPSWVGSPAPRM